MTGLSLVSLSICLLVRINTFSFLLSCFIRYSTKATKHKLCTNNPRPGTRIRWLIYLHSFPFISVWESLLHAPVIYRHIESTFPCCYYVPHTGEAGDGRTKLKNNQCIKSHDHLRVDEVDENVIWTFLFQILGSSVKNRRKWKEKTLPG